MSNAMHKPCQTEPSLEKNRHDSSGQSAENPPRSAYNEATPRNADLSMFFSKSHADRITLTLSDAKNVLLVRALEEAQADGDKSVKDVTPADFAEAGLKAAHALGEKASAEKLLTTRAENVLTALRARSLKPDVSTRALFVRSAGVLFLLLSFAAGALFDRIVPANNIVNLLSPPFWTVIAWNLLVYVFLFLGLFGLFGKRIGGEISLPLRNALFRFGSGIAYTGIHRGWKAAFLESWVQTVTPLIRAHVSRLLHLAALLFAAGLAVSLLVKGFGTSYWAGWESTWLANKPEAVKAFVDWTYGLIPAVGGLPAMPDAETIASMRIDRLPYLTEAVSAAPWLIRMMALLLIVVAAPRLFLALTATGRIRRFKKNVTIDASDPYYADILAECRQDAAAGRLVILARDAALKEKSPALTAFLAAWPDKKGQTLIGINPDDEALIVPDAATTAVENRRPVTLFWCDASVTPEDEVQGRTIEILKAACPPEKAGFACVIDRSRFAEKFRRYPARIDERTAVWKAFIESRDAAALVADAGELPARELVRNLRRSAVATAVKPL